MEPEAPFGCLALISRSAKSGGGSMRTRPQPGWRGGGGTTGSIRGSLLSSLSDVIAKAAARADGRHAACHGCHFASASSSGGLVKKTVGLLGNNRCLMGFFFFSQIKSCLSIIQCDRQVLYRTWPLDVLAASLHGCGLSAP